VARYTSSDTTANVQLVTRDATAPEDAVISVVADDVERAYVEAQQHGQGVLAGSDNPSCNQSSMRSSNASVSIRASVRNSPIG